MSDKSHGSIFTLNFPAGSLPNLGVGHHLEVNGNSGTSKHSTQANTHYPVPLTFTGTIFRPWCSEAVTY